MKISDISKQLNVNLSKIFEDDDWRFEIKDHTNTTWATISGDTENKATFSIDTFEPGSHSREVMSFSLIFDFEADEASWDEGDVQETSVEEAIQKFRNTLKMLQTTS